MSAYELAVKNGFAGTEKQWLNSLKGGQGAKKGDDRLIILRVDNDHRLFPQEDGKYVGKYLQ